MGRNGPIFPLLVARAGHEHSPDTLQAVRQIHLSRALGWGCFFPLYLLIFRAANAPVWALVILALMSLVYPHVMTLITVRSAAPMRTVSRSAIFEAAMIGFFAEFVCLDPVVVTVTFTVVVFNAGALHGMRHGLLAAAVALGTAALVDGRLRATPSLELSPTLRGAVIAALLAYIALTTHFVYSTIQGYIRSRNSLQNRKTRIENLHRHLVDSIARPFISDDELLDVIGEELDAEQLAAYAARVRSRQRLENLGRRAAMVSHDLRNLIHPVILSSEVLREELEDPEQLELLEDVLAAGHRAKDMLGQLVKSSHDERPSTQRCDGAAVVREVVSILRTRTRGTAIRVREVADESDGPLQIAMGSDALHRVLMNLGTNALQALDGVGSLHLEAGVLRAEGAPDGLPEGLGPGRAMTLVVRDDGPGMPADVLERIFEPYFTTREGSGGTGLGLSNSFALVSDAGGVMRVMSEEGHGTTFQIVLPSVSRAR